MESKKYHLYCILKTEYQHFIMVSNIYKHVLLKIQYDNLYYILGNLEDEEKVLEWLSYQIKNDEIEDVTDEMLDILINKLSNVAVLFCVLFAYFRKKLPKMK